MRGRRVPRTIGGLCTSCGSTKLFQKTSTSGLRLVSRSIRTLCWISLLFRLKVVCKYASYSVLGTVLAIITLSQGTPSQPSIRTARRVDRYPNLWFTELAPGGVFVLLFSYRLILRYNWYTYMMQERLQKNNSDFIFSFADKQCWGKCSSTFRIFQRSPILQQQHWYFHQWIDSYLLQLHIQNKRFYRYELNRDYVIQLLIFFLSN